MEYSFLNCIFQRIQWHCAKIQDESEEQHLQDSEEIIYSADGLNFYYFPRSLLQAYITRTSSVKWDLLHTILHCMYLHPYISIQEETDLWNLACDISVEMVLSRLAKNRDSRRTDLLYQNTIDYLFRHKCVTAFQIAGENGIRKMPGYDFQKLIKIFYRDEHSSWIRKPKEHIDAIRFWEKSSLGMNAALKGKSRRRGSSSANDIELISRSRRGRYDYHEFLQKFMYTREEIETDPDSFDYIYYTLGMNRFGNIPLIEYLEYREVTRMEQMVIAIDTSGSCSREIVQQFLEETYRILSNRENFFRKMLVYIIQCDCDIQNISVIHNEEEWKACHDQIEIHGRGGTDFTPVFRYIEKEQQENRLNGLKALIYFTDGDGVYPDRETSYETAFAFLEKNEHMKKVPKWATILTVSEK